MERERVKVIGEGSLENGGRSSSASYRGGTLAWCLRV